MRWLPGLLVALALAIAALWAASGPASAQQTLDDYRVSGVIAERFDGYVEIRKPDAPAAARALVAEVNTKRRELYTRRARESDVPVEQVGKLFATKIAETAPAGTYFRKPDGSYVRK